MERMTKRFVVDYIIGMADISYSAETYNKIVSRMMKQKASVLDDNCYYINTRDTDDDMKLAARVVIAQLAQVIDITTLEHVNKTRFTN